MLKSLNLFSQKKSLILLMYFNRVQVYVWTQKSLELAGEFGKEPDEAFIAILEEYRNYPVIIATDYLEESFRHDTGVHVSGPDRTALLERKLNYSFRNTPYRAATIVGRETEGRKDDRILLSALTKPEMLEPWIKLLLERQIQIQSVTSVAYLMQSYAQKAGLNDKYLMIVSIEKGSEIRQTFLRGGKIQFSRLTSLTTQESASLPDAINHESLQIRQYLERIKLLPFDSQMVIRVFSPIAMDEQTLESLGNDLNVFQLFKIQDLAETFALTIDGLDKGPTTLYLGRILQRSTLPNVYAPLNVLKYHKLSNLASGLRSSGIGLVIIMLLVKAFTLIDTIGNWDLVDNLQARTTPLNNQYDQLTQRFPETPIPSAEMALVVETAEHIDLNSYFLEDTMTMIGQALMVAPELQLASIEWMMAATQGNSDNQNAGGFGSFGRPAPSANAVGGQDIQNATIDDRTKLHVIIEGQAFSPQSYREAQNQVLYFQSALESLPGVTITTSKMPTDVRVDTNVSTLVDNNALRSPFTIEFDLEPL